MLNPTSLLADALGRNLAETYRRIYGDQEPHIAAGLDEAARLVIERIASSDALYHDCQHTALVTLCAQDILRGRRIERVVTPSDWGHTIFAALTHDIGYVRGVCPGDTAERFRHRCRRQHGDAAARRLRRVPHALSRRAREDHGPRALRARSLHRRGADRRGHRAHPLPGARRRRPRRHRHRGGAGAGRPISSANWATRSTCAKLNALYHEFVETGVNEKLGYRSPADMVESLPAILLEQGRALYRRRAALSRDDDGGQAMDRDPLQPHLRDRAQSPADRTAGWAFTAAEISDGLGAG